MRNVLARALTAIAALLVAGWLGLGLRATILEQRAADQLTGALTLGDPTPAQKRALSSAAEDFDRATALNPDGVPRMFYAQTILILGERERAREIATEVTGDEPDNLQVWQTARAIALALPDRTLEATANRRIRELSPR